MEPAGQARQRERRLAHRALWQRLGRMAAVVAVGVVLMAAACTVPVPVEFPDGPGDVVTTAEADTVGPIDFAGTDLVDAHGRTVQIHGINMVRKSAPFHVSPEETGFDETVESLRRSGFNGVRLGVWMAALMPSPGEVDETYLAEVQRAADALADAGMWVLLDFHQDVFTGLPAWATTETTAALSPTLAGLEDSFWALAYFAPRSMQQWEDLYDRVAVADGASAVELMGDGVAAVAERFAGDPNVIGIDLLNEPWPGEAFGSCVTGNCAARYRQLRSIYEEYTARVRAVAPDMKLWWGPFNFGPPFHGVDPPSDDDVAVGYHSYCLYTDGGEPVQPAPLEHTICGALYEAQTTEALSLGRRWDTPVILGEFGASASPLNTTRLTQLADEHQLSWMYWDDNYYRVAPEVVRTDLVRTYAQATAGEILEHRFEPGSGDFRLRYRPDGSITAPTSIVVPSEVYPDGYEVSVQGGVVTSEPDDGRLTTVPEPGAVEVLVAVSRA